MIFKLGDVLGNITKRYPNGDVEVNYDGTILTLPESENELYDKGKAANGKEIGGYSVLEEMINADIIDEEHPMYDEVKSALASKNQQEIKDVLEEMINSGIIDKSSPYYKKSLKAISKASNGAKIDESIARGIMDNLGGMGKIKVMTGANTFIALQNGVSFRLPYPRTNYVKITLSGLDLYDLEVGRIRAGKYTIVETKTGLYDDMLRPALEKATGLTFRPLFKNGGGVNGYSEAEKWWGNDLSLNEQKEYAKKHLLSFEYDELLGSTAQYSVSGSGRRKIFITKIWEGEGSPKSILKGLYSNGGGIEDLKNFDVTKLDPLEERQYSDYLKHSSKEEALQILINNVDGDYSQLSPSLERIAEKQNPSGVYGDDEAANGIKVDTGVFGEKENWRITASGINGVGIYPKDLYTKEQAEKLFTEKYMGKALEDKVYIEFLNKEKGFKKDTKHFKSYADAVKWARDNFERFDPDMIKYAANGRELATDVAKGELKPGVTKGVYDFKNQESWFAFNDAKKAVWGREKGTFFNEAKQAFAEQMGAEDMNLVKETDKDYVFELIGNQTEITNKAMALEKQGLDFESWGSKKRVTLPKELFTSSEFAARFPAINFSANGSQIAEQPAPSGESPNKTRSTPMKIVTFKNKNNPRLVITVKAYPNMSIFAIENLNNIRFPYVVGQTLNMGHTTWACNNGYLVNNEDPCPEKKIFGMRAKDIPQGHPLRHIYPGKFRVDGGPVEEPIGGVGLLLLKKSIRGWSGWHGDNGKKAIEYLKNVVRWNPKNRGLDRTWYFEIRDNAVRAENSGNTDLANKLWKELRSLKTKSDIFNKEYADGKDDGSEFSRAIKYLKDIDIEAHYESGSFAGWTIRDAKTKKFIRKAWGSEDIILFAFEEQQRNQALGLTVEQVRKKRELDRQEEEKEAEDSDENKWIVQYMSTDDDDVAKVWVYANSREEAIENAEDDHSDIGEIISVEKMSNGE